MSKIEFEEQFHDARRHKPIKGEVLAVYRATAELVEGVEKLNLIEVLTKPNKAVAATNVMRKLFGASERDSVRVPRQMLEDMIGGMSVDDVNKKPYRYKFEMFYYVRPEHVPKNDPHWETVSILHVNADYSVTKAALESASELVTDGSI